MTPRTWNEVKAKIIGQDGTVKACAQHLDCTTEALRKAFQGLCPDVARKMERHLGINLGAKAHSRRKGSNREVRCA